MTAAPEPRPRGLSSAEAVELLREHGPNLVRRAPSVSPWRLLARQFQGALVWLLIAAATTSAALGERTDAIAIAAILVLNAAIGLRSPPQPPPDGSRGEGATARWKAGDEHSGRFSNFAGEPS